METNKFSIEAALKVGWQKTKEEFLFLFCVGLVAFVVSMILGSAGEEGSPVALLASILSVAFGIFINVGIIKILLMILNNEKPYAKIFLEITPSQFFRYLGASIVYGIAVLIGIILLVIPGIIMGIRGQFTYYFVVEKGMGPIEALKASWNATRGETWNLFLFTIIVIALNLFGLLLVGVGLLITIPITLIAVAYIYKKLTGAMIPQVEVQQALPTVQEKPQSEAAPEKMQTDQSQTPTNTPPQQ